MNERTLMQIAAGLIVGHATVLYWFTVIKAVRVLSRFGATATAERISRASGLRARLEALLRESDRSID